MTHRNGQAGEPLGLEAVLLGGRAPGQEQCVLHQLLGGGPLQVEPLEKTVVLTDTQLQVSSWWLLSEWLSCVGAGVWGLG